MTQIADEHAILMAQLINEDRASAGLDPLRIEVHLNASSRIQSEHMDNVNELTHSGPNGNSIADRVQESGFDLEGSWRLTENVGHFQGYGVLGGEDVERMHSAFMQSEGHRGNILDPDVDYIGIHIHEGEMPGAAGIQIPTLFFTINFAATDGDVLIQDPDTGELTLYQNGIPVDQDEPEEPEGSGDQEEGPAPPPEEDEPEIPSVPLEEDDDFILPEEDPDETQNPNGCFIATAAYGERLHPEVVALRRFRDLVLSKTKFGKAMIVTYQKFGPVLSKFVSPERTSGRVFRTVLGLMSRRLDPGPLIQIGKPL